MEDNAAAPEPPAPQGASPDRAALAAATRLDPAAREKIADRAAAFVTGLREGGDSGLMEAFLAEYGLASPEGRALMGLAEALLRIPDAATQDALIADMLTGRDWAAHRGHAQSRLVNAGTEALALSAGLLKPSGGKTAPLRTILRHAAAPATRLGARRAMHQFGDAFVFAETIDDALARGQRDGGRHSFDMLGEAARTEADAARYHRHYAEAIRAIAATAPTGALHDRPAISVKLSALHPRYEPLQADRVMAQLPDRLRPLLHAAAAAGIGLTIDAEEAERLALSLDVIEAALDDPGLDGWAGFGLAVQAYAPTAIPVIERMARLADLRGQPVAIRLVKGAYWDSEIKAAQVRGTQLPVYVTKADTDLAYLAAARRLLDLRPAVFPQFATHNAHTVAAILHMAGNSGEYEFQRLHGMGDGLHARLAADTGRPSRVYAPVGPQDDLLAYLVRRLLENGASSSFVHRLLDPEIPARAAAPDPFDAPQPPGPALRPGPALFPDRRNARGWDLHRAEDRAALDTARAAARSAHDAQPPVAAPVIATDTPPPHGPAAPVLNPADPAQQVGTCHEATAAQVDAALDAARPWDAPPAERRATLEAAADLFEADHGALFDLLAREAGKTLPDAIAELREAVDFLRYYALQIDVLDAPPAGRVACVSPWNFPLAIFTGQCAAALAAGNAVLAKPAPETPMVAARAVALLHRAGVPGTALQLLPGGGETGARLTSDPRTCGVAFTGSTATARGIRSAMAVTLAPGAPLVAETGGLNAMIVDSTALPEQVVRDIVVSAFQSAGQRCSALRCLYLQEDIAPKVEEMLFGAMDLLRLGDPADPGTDIGPLISAKARDTIAAHVDAARAEGRLLHQSPAPGGPGHHLPPAAIRLTSIAELEREVFGPVLHIVRYKAARLDDVLAEINATGYGLTFGIHSRIEGRIHHAAETIRAGNIYVNRNQIGAVVGSQPFGGEGLSGTGPKAGGPWTLAGLTAPDHVSFAEHSAATPGADPAEVARALAAPRRDLPLSAETLPGPTGESNLLRCYPRPPLLCLGPGAEAAARQVRLVEGLGGHAVAAPGLAPAALSDLPAFGGALYWGPASEARAYARALADRPGPILPLIPGTPQPHQVLTERHICTDITAAGGNASLLAG